jgi:hypothetical protein
MPPPLNFLPTDRAPDSTSLEMSFRLYRASKLRSDLKIELGPGSGSDSCMFTVKNEGQDTHNDID